MSSIPSFISSVFVGMLAAAGALTAELFALAAYAAFFFAPHLADPSLLMEGLGPLLLFAAIEEGSKYLFLRKRLLANTVERYHSAHALAFGLGFAAIEIAILSRSSAPTIQDFPFIGGMALLHLSTVLLSALAIRFFRHPFLFGFAPAAALHFLYNFAIREEASAYTALALSLLAFCSAILASVASSRFPVRGRQEA
jgi:hypothetical protein